MFATVIRAVVTNPNYTPEMANSDSFHPNPILLIVLFAVIAGIIVQFIVGLDR